RPARVQREVSAERPPARGVSTGSSGLTNLGCLPASGVCLFFGDNQVKIFTAIMWATVAALGSIFPLAAAAAAEGGVLLAAGQGDKNVTHETARTAGKTLHVKPTDDFEVTGDGRAAAWEKVAWEPLARRAARGHDYEAKIKLLYSKTGLYVLFSGT